MGAAMDPSQITNPSGFYWLGVVVAFLAGSSVLGTVIVLLIKRLFANRDKQGEVTDANQGKAIDQDVVAFKSQEDRLIRLEQRFDELQDKYTILMADHAGIQKENEYLTRDNNRLQREVEMLRKRIKELEDLMKKTGIDHSQPPALTDEK
jgi:FtsZ-binding cell division protein ZapB